MEILAPENDLPPITPPTFDLPAPNFQKMCPPAPRRSPINLVQIGPLQNFLWSCLCKFFKYVSGFPKHEFPPYFSSSFRISTYQLGWVSPNRATRDPAYPDNRSLALSPTSTAPGGASWGSPGCKLCSLALRKKIRLAALAKNKFPLLRHFSSTPACVWLRETCEKPPCTYPIHPGAISASKPPKTRHLTQLTPG